MLEELSLANLVTINMSTLIRTLKQLHAQVQPLRHLPDRLLQLERAQTLLGLQLQNLRVRQDSFSNDLKAQSQQIEAKQARQPHPVPSPVDQEKLVLKIVEQTLAAIPKRLSLLSMKQVEDWTTKTLREWGGQQGKQNKKGFDEVKSMVLSLQKSKADLSEFERSNSSNIKLAAEMERVTSTAERNSVRLLALEKVNWQVDIDRLRADLKHFQDQVQRSFPKFAEYEELLQLEDMQIKLMEHSVKLVLKRSAEKCETKKALIYLEQKLNRSLQLTTGEASEQGEALAVATPWKCVSCNKNVERPESKVEPLRAWQGFMGKDKRRGASGRKEQYQKESPRDKQSSLMRHFGMSTEHFSSLRHEYQSTLGGLRRKERTADCES